MAVFSSSTFFVEFASGESAVCFDNNYRTYLGVSCVHVQYRLRIIPAMNRQKLLEKLASSFSFFAVCDLHSRRCSPLRCLLVLLVNGSEERGAEETGAVTHCAAVGYGGENRRRYRRAKNDCVSSRAEDGTPS